jgi:RimJ/RimL family protein N-acetyltransferase
MPGPVRAEGGNTTRAPRRTIDTDLPNLRLIALSPDDAEAFYDLIDRNRTHLTQHGDWTDLGDATSESVPVSLSNLDDRNAQFGIWLDRRLIGRADLNARAPGNFVLSYWLGREFTGKGDARQRPARRSSPMARRSWAPEMSTPASPKGT